jgi:hypothetical protein
MLKFKIMEHLAAKDLVTFRTLWDETSKAHYKVVAPYHPVVVTQFSRYKEAKLEEEAKLKEEAKSKEEAKLKEEARWWSWDWRTGVQHQQQQQD